MKKRRTLPVAASVLALVVLLCLLVAVPAAAGDGVDKDKFEPSALTAPTLLVPAPVGGGEILLVNDGDASSAVLAEASLTRLGRTYDRVDIGVNALPDAATAASYHAIVWLHHTLGTSTAADTIKDYLDADCRVVIFDHDLAWSYTADALLTQYLEASYGGIDAGSDGPITGLDIMDGVDIDISGDPYPDNFTISGANAAAIFQNTAPRTGYAALRIAKDGYRAVYCAWNFMYTGTTAAENDAVLGRALDWLMAARVYQQLAAGAVDDLYGMYGGRQLAMARTYASGALGGGLWLDENHLSERRGSMFFTYQLNAIKLLTTGRNPWAAAALPILDDMVEAAARLAHTAVADAVAAGGNPSSLDAAQYFLSLGDQYAAAGRAAAAVGAYANAWKTAVLSY